MLRCCSSTARPAISPPSTASIQPQRRTTLPHSPYCSARAIWRRTPTLARVPATPHFARMRCTSRVRSGPAASDRGATLSGAGARVGVLQPVILPAVRGLPEPWVRTPVDLFIMKALREKKLSPPPALDRARLIRRVTYDLTGLPPTPAE